MKIDCKIPDYPHPTVLCAMREPTPEDTNYGHTIWVCRHEKPYKVFQGEKGLWVFLGVFHPYADEKPREETVESWEAAIKDVFLCALLAAKEIKPNTPEWNLIWNSLHCYKEYAERKAKDDVSAE